MSPQRLPTDPPDGFLNGDSCVQALLSFVDEVMDVKLEDVEAARQLLSPESPLSARDAVHVAVMRRCGVSKILSFDKGFEGIEGIERTS